MRNFVKAGIAGVGSVVLTGAALASTPTTAAGLAGAVDLADAKAGALAIAGLLIALGVVLMGVRLIMSKFRAKV